MHVRLLILAPLLILLASPIAGAARVTFAQDVAPILFERCVTCHRPGQVAPMSFTTYEEVRPWAKSIRRQVVSRDMPPFLAEGPLGHFENDPRLTDDQIQTITRWVDTGAQRGNIFDMPALPAFADNAWAIGEPDIVIDFPRVDLPTEDEDSFVYVYGAATNKTNLWVKAVELRTERLDALHHANVFRTRPDEEFLDDPIKLPHEAGTWADRGLPYLAWLPGKGPLVVGDGSAMLWQAGLGVVVDCHYTRPDEPGTDRLRLGILLADGEIDRVHSAIGAQMKDFLILPNMGPIKKRYWKTFPVDARVRGFGSHMHYRGSSTHFTLHYPDGRSETVFRIPQWDADWQQEYFLAEPFEVPKGTRVEFVGEWDNTPNNPNNPYYDEPAKLGTRAKDEMFSGRIIYHPVEPLAKPLHVVNGIAVPRFASD